LPGQGDGRGCLTVAYFSLSPPLTAIPARFGGIPLVRKQNAVLHDTVPRPVPYPQKELVSRLLKRRCELCEEAGAVPVHQVRKLASLGEPGRKPPLPNPVPGGRAPGATPGRLLV
jgi:hypothetical protein